MLTLRRKVDEDVVITFPGTNGPVEVIVRVLDIKGSIIALGFDGPKEVIIDRKEVHERRKQND